MSVFFSLDCPPPPVWCCCCCCHSPLFYRSFHGQHRVVIVLLRRDIFHQLLLFHGPFDVRFFSFRRRSLLRRASRSRLFRSLTRSGRRRREPFRSSLRNLLRERSDCRRQRRVQFLRFLGKFQRGIQIRFVRRRGKFLARDVQTSRRFVRVHSCLLVLG